MAINRREFLKNSAKLASTVTLTSIPVFRAIAQDEPQTSSAWSKVIIAEGDSPAENVRSAIHALGGIQKFVKTGDTVLLKPNSMANFTEEYAVNTNPAVVGEVARLCRQAGASKVFAITHDGARPWKRNGIGAALKAAGATYRSANDIDDYQRVALPKGLVLRETDILKELLTAKVFINIPVAKQSPEVFVTIGLKNFMGLNWDRMIMHNTHLHKTIADLASVRKPDLTIVDCTRILLNNGPYGPGTVREMKQVIASTDPVAADAYTATLFKLDPRDIDHIRYASELGLGEIDLKKLAIEKV
jgi:uncharacterized protein (DUF362 family)